MVDIAVQIATLLVPNTLAAGIPRQPATVLLWPLVGSGRPIPAWVVPYDNDDRPHLSQVRCRLTIRCGRPKVSPHVI